MSRAIADKLWSMAEEIGPTTNYTDFAGRLSALAQALDDAHIESKPKHAVGVSVLLTNQKGHLLLGRRKPGIDAGGLLSTPGGRLELNETVLECAAREFREETGAGIIPNECTVIDARKHNRYGNQYVMFYVYAQRYVGTISNTEPEKHDDWHFVNMLDFRPEECTEPTDVLAKLAARIAFGPLFDSAAERVARQLFSSIR